MYVTTGTKRQKLENNQDIRRNTLNKDIMLLIFSFLNGQQILCCFGISRTWRDLSQNSQLWKVIFLQECLFSPQPSLSFDDIKSKARSLVHLQHLYRQGAPSYVVKLQYLTGGNVPFFGINTSKRAVTIHDNGTARQWNLDHSFDYSRAFFYFLMFVHGDAGLINQIKYIAKALLIISYSNNETQLWNAEQTLPEKIATLPKQVPLTASCGTEKEAFVALQEGSICSVYAWDFKNGIFKEQPLFSENESISYLKLQGTQIFYTIAQSLKSWDSKTKTKTTLFEIPHLTEAKQIIIQNGILSFIGGHLRALEFWDVKTKQLLCTWSGIQSYVRHHHFIVMLRHNKPTLDIRSLQYSSLLRTLDFEYDQSFNVTDSQLRVDPKGNIYICESLLSKDPPGITHTLLRCWSFS